MKNKQESQEKCCDEGVCLNHLKDHQLFCDGRCHNVSCSFRALRESHEAVEEDWESEFDRLFVDENMWEEGNGETKFVAIGNIKAFIKEVTSQEYERGREDEAVSHTTEDTNAFEVGRLQGIAEEKSRALDFADHEQRKLLDGFAHPDKCDECRPSSN